MPRITALVLTFSLALAGCSGGSPLDRLRVGGSDKAPKVTVPAEFSVDATTTKVLKPGTGAKLAQGDIVKVDYVGYNGRTGKQFDNSFGRPGSLAVDLTEGKAALPGLLKALKGQRAGARLLTAIPPVDGFASDRPEVGIQKADTMVFYIHVLEKVAKVAAGTKVALPDNVPAVVVKDGRPTGFTRTASTPASVGESEAHIAIRGTGAQVAKGATVVLHYLGQVYPQGAVFDASWDRGTPSTFPLDNLVKCWQDLLPGVPIGSRVVLECTAADAYGDSPPPGGEIKPGDDLLFVVDVLDAY